MTQENLHDGVLGLICLGMRSQVFDWTRTRKSSSYYGASNSTLAVVDEASASSAKDQARMSKHTESKGVIRCTDPNVQVPNN